MDIRAGKSQQYNQLCETYTLAAYSYQQMKKIPASRNWYGTGMTHPTILIISPNPGSDNHAAESCINRFTHLPCQNKNSDAPLATGAPARQKQRSICFCLDFLLHFFIKKKVETPQSKTLPAISTINNHLLYL